MSRRALQAPRRPTGELVGRAKVDELQRVEGAAGTRTLRGDAWPLVGTWRRPTCDCRALDPCNAGRSFSSRCSSSTIHNVVSK
jgi:hypothetical protein